MLVEVPPQVGRSHVDHGLRPLRAPPHPRPAYPVLEHVLACPLSAPAAHRQPSDEIPVVAPSPGCDEVARCVQEGLPSTPFHPCLVAIRRSRFPACRTPPPADAAAGEKRPPLTICFTQERLRSAYRVSWRKDF